MDADKTLKALVDEVSEEDIKLLVEKAAQELAIVLIAHSVKKKSDGAEYIMEMSSNSIKDMRYRLVARLEPIK